MAIKTKFDFRGLPVPEAYVRIDRFVFTNKTSCRGYVEIYASEEAAHAIPRRQIDDTIIDFVYDFNSPISLHGQAYNALQERGDFPEAQGVFEEGQVDPRVVK